MTVFVGFLRAVNVGGTGKLLMSDLRQLSETLGFCRVRTHIQSGNVVFESDDSEHEVRRALSDALTEHMGKRTDVVVRSGVDLQRALHANPFPDAEPAKVALALSNEFVPTTLLDEVSVSGGEHVVLRKREIYVYYPEGMGRSRLKLPEIAGPITVRNINTITALVAMASEIS
ncbi:MAG: hypothetical protein JWL94_765 [Microbacteriaceae bacterium]|jgi:uncharacterized protein (DUF1697 family)|nr:hypothetical protein [Microbacteriaceae bacterium]HEV7956073.1 DUF1697 domain-containing protein [Marisediminicola sp.]